MADTPTTTYGLVKPEVGASEDSWGDKINDNFDDLDDILDGTTPVTGIDINSGTIDGTVIGGTTPAAGSFTTGSFTGNVTAENFIANNDIFITSSSPTLKLTDTDAADQFTALSNSAGSAVLDARNGAANGSIIFRGGGGNVVTEYARFSTAGHLGIGTSSPSAALDVVGDAEINGNITVASASPVMTITETDADAAYRTAQLGVETGNFLIQTRNSAGTFVSNDYVITKNAAGASGHQWRLGNTTKLFLNSNGLGVNTTSPSATLDVVGDAEINGNSTVTGVMTISNSGPYLKLNDTTADATDFFVHANSNNFYVLADRGGDGSFETPHPLQLNADTGLGYVFGEKIWTESNVTDLTIYGTAANIFWKSSNVNHTLAFARDSDGTFGLYDAENGRTWFRHEKSASASNQEMMLLESGGELTIGKFSARTTFKDDGSISFGKAPDTFPANNTSGSGVGISSAGRLSAVAQSDICMSFGRNTTTGATANFYYNGSAKGSISVTGSSVAYNTTSDYRLKENITPVQGAADIVKAMRPVTYTFKSDGSWHDGFLAHELQELHPRAVLGEKDAMKDEEYEVTPAVYEDVIIPAVEAVAEVPAVYDEEGVLVSAMVPAVEAQPERTEQQLVSEAVMGTRSVPDYQGVDYSKLTPILTAALQEALNKIDALEARLTALESA